MGNSDNPTVKKDYSKPAVDTERIFEKDALACSKCQSHANVTVLGSCVRGVVKKS